MTSSVDVESLLIENAIARERYLPSEFPQGLPDDGSILVVNFPEYERLLAGRPVWKGLDIAAARIAGEIGECPPSPRPAAKILLPDPGLARADYFRTLELLSRKVEQQLRYVTVRYSVSGPAGARSEGRSSLKKHRGATSSWGLLLETEIYPESRRDRNGRRYASVVATWKNLSADPSWFYND